MDLLSCELPEDRGHVYLPPGYSEHERHPANAKSINPSMHFPPGHLWLHLGLSAPPRLFSGVLPCSFHLAPPGQYNHPSEPMDPLEYSPSLGPTRGTVRKCPQSFGTLPSPPVLSHPLPPGCWDTGLNYYKACRFLMEPCPHSAQSPSSLSYCFHRLWPEV